MRAMKKTVFTALAILMLLSLSVIPALAAVDVDAEGSITVSYKDMETDAPIPGAQFDAFRIADADADRQYTVTEAFAEAPIAFNPQNNKNWAELGDDFKGYVYATELKADYTGTTDADGLAVLSGVKPGLYLIVGYRTTVDNYTYFADPFLTELPLPGEEGGWDYDITVLPKSGKEYNPPDTPGDRVLTRKVEKQWDDEGYEMLRPLYAEVTLFKNGEKFDTVELTRENNWHYVWDNLDASCEWTIAETAIEGYAGSVSLNGITWLLVNTIDPTAGIPVQKQITGDKPGKASDFIFLLTAENKNNPMPEGSKDGVKEVTVSGAGSARFGEIPFTAPGRYIYTVREKNTSLPGYTYDTTVYTLSYTVTENDGRLETELSVTRGGQETTAGVSFVNSYSAKQAQQTGQLWWPVPVLLFAGMILVTAGLCRRRRCRG